MPWNFGNPALSRTRQQKTGAEFVTHKRENANCLAKSKEEV
jgi:hypothetical protein